MHTGLNQWSGCKYPFVGGHEIYGIATEVGEDVGNIKTGDRVGVGCIVDSCRECEMCHEGDEN